MKVTIKETRKEKTSLKTSDFKNGDGLLWQPASLSKLIYIVFENGRLLTPDGDVCTYSVERMLHDYGPECEKVNLELIATRRA